MKDESDKKELINPAIEVFRRGCTDGYCYVKGRANCMHTNGGCHCISKLMKSDVSIHRKNTLIQQAIMNAEKREPLFAKPTIDKVRNVLNYF